MAVLLGPDKKPTGQFRMVTAGRQAFHFQVPSEQVTGSKAIPDINFLFPISGWHENINYSFSYFHIFYHIFQFLLFTLKCHCMYKFTLEHILLLMFYLR